jgi:transposase-like protein
MTSYPKEQKAELIAKMLAPQNVSVPQLAQETGIPKDTLYCWRLQAKKAAGVVPAVGGPSTARWSSEEKFTVVVETALLNEAELGAYCRQRGLYAEQVSSWREACRRANDEPARSGGEPRSAQGAQTKRIKHLESELRRKEKALAEAAALLVLQKKARALWGEIEDD